MAYAPVQLFAQPMEDYAAYWVKFYEQGTVTPLSMATDSTGGTLIVKAEISSGGTVDIGFIKTAGDALFIPFVNGDYDGWLFPTSTEADANDTTNAIQIADNLNADPANGILASEVIVSDSDGMYAGSDAEAVLAEVNSSIDDITSLKSIEPAGVTGNKKTIYVRGYSSPGDGGEGTFYWDSASTETDNGGTIIKVTAVTTGRWIRLYTGPASAKWFGAKGDGTTDDTASMQAIIDAVNDIYIPDGVFLTDTELTATITDDFKISGPGTIKNITSIDILTINNTQILSTTLSAAATSKGTVFSLTSVTGIQPGDLISIISTKSWDAENAIWVAGELNTVRSISGSSITVHDKSKDTYLSGDVVNVYRPHKLILNEFGLLGDSTGSVSGGQRGLNVNNFLAPEFNKFKSNDSDKHCLAIVQCLGSFLTDSEADSIPEFSGFGYGLVIGSSSNTVVLGGSYKAGRHGVTHGDSFPCRSNKFYGAHIGNDLSGTQTAFDTHVNTEDTYANGCIINGAIGNNGRRSIFKDCDITGTVSCYLSLDDYHPDEYFKLIGCNINTNDGSLPGLRVRPVFEKNDTVYLGELVVENTTINGTQLTGVNIIQFTNDFASTVVNIPKVTFNGGSVEFDGATDLFGVDCNPANTYTIGDFVIRNAAWVTNQRMMRMHSGIDRFKAHNSQITVNGTVELMFQKIGGDLFEIDGCILDVTNGGAAGTVSPTVVKITNTEFKNIDTTLFTLTGATELQYNNITSPISGTFTSLPDKVYNFKDQDNVTGYGSAAPIVGTWAAGDKIYDSTPSASGTMGWVCVTAGTPGTWKTFGNIAA